MLSSAMRIIPWAFMAHDTLRLPVIQGILNQPKLHLRSLQKGPSLLRQREGLGFTAVAKEVGPGSLRARRRCGEFVSSRGRVGKEQRVVAVLSKKVVFKVHFPLVLSFAYLRNRARLGNG